MCLLSFGQADRLASHQKQRTWKEEIWDISIFHWTNETTIHVLLQQPCFLLPSRISSIPPSVSLSFALASLLHMLICFSLFHYHYLRVFFPLSFLISIAIPSFGTVRGRRRCFNESVLSSSLGQVDNDWCREEVKPADWIAVCTNKHTSMTHTLTRLAVCLHVHRTSVEMPAFTTSDRDGCFARTWWEEQLVMINWQIHMWLCVSVRVCVCVQVNSNSCGTRLVLSSPQRGFGWYHLMEKRSVYLSGFVLYRIFLFFCHQTVK